MNNDITLAKLIGSPKQIKWAEDIRYERMNGMGHYDKTGSVLDWKWIPDNERIALAARITTAKWWIDHRDCTMSLDLLKAAAASEAEYLDKEKEACKRRAEYARYQENLRKGRIAPYDIDGKLSH